MVNSKSKLKSYGGVFLFQTILNRKYQTNAPLPGPCILFIQTHFYQSYQFHWYTKLNENIIQDLPPNWIIGFLEFYKYLLNCFILIPFLLEQFDECSIYDH